MSASESLALEKIWAAVPVFNNKTTLRGVVEACLKIVPHVVVVDDGSTDANVSGLLTGLNVTVLKHETNQGKGRAILMASRYIEQQGGRYMITIDADGQHDPEDIKKFFPLINENRPAIIIGKRDFRVPNVPFSSKFGRSFANFWLYVETGKTVSDCQSGFRAYPVYYLNRLQFRGAHYDFEAEVLARAAWAGLELITVDITVYYPKPEERVSSFKPFLDNFRLTHRHAMLVWRRLLPIRHKKLVGKEDNIEWSLLRHPGKVLKGLLSESASPQGLALSAAVGMFLGVLPLLFVHSVVILYVSVQLKLNKIVALNVQHLAVPPFIPAICIEVGYYLRHGVWLTDLSFETVFQQFSSRLYEWFLGSLIIAPLAAVLVGTIMFITATVIKRIWYSHASSE